MVLLDGTIKCKITSARDRDAAGRLYELDDKVDALYRKHLNEAISTPADLQSKNKLQNHDVIFLRY
jgi:phosphate uptake regulator